MTKSIRSLRKAAKEMTVRPDAYVPNKRVYRRLEHRLVISALFCMPVGPFVALAVS